jgi:hypothetical protein
MPLLYCKFIAVTERGFANLLKNCDATTNRLRAIFLQNPLLTLLHKRDKRRNHPSLLQPGKIILHNLRLLLAVEIGKSATGGLRSRQSRRAAIIITTSPGAPKEINRLGQITAADPLVLVNVRELMDENRQVVTAVFPPFPRGK